MEAEREDRKQREALREEERKRLEERRRIEQEKLVCAFVSLYVVHYCSLAYRVLLYLNAHSNIISYKRTIMSMLISPVNNPYNNDFDVAFLTLVSRRHNRICFFNYF